MTVVERPTYMRAAVLHGIGEIRLEERPVPEPAPDEVLLRVSAVGVCGSDTHYFREGRIGKYVVEKPLVLGHESAGVVVAVGSDVPASRIGDRVSVEPQKTCGHCVYCRSGRYNLCASVAFFATPPVDGAFQEFVVVPSERAFTIPEAVSDEEAALVEPLSVAIAAVRKASVTSDSRVLIAGAGPIGALVCQVCATYGAKQIVVTDTNLERLSRAERWGATAAFDPRESQLGMKSFDAFIDTSGSQVAVSAGIAALARAGTAVLVGMGADLVELSVPMIQNRELVITGLFRYANTWPEAIDLVNAGKVDLTALVTDRYGLEDTAVALANDGSSSSMKSIIFPTRR